MEGKDMKKLFIILTLCLTGCLSMQPRPTISDRMNLIMMDDTLSHEDKMLRLKMLEIEVAEQARKDDMRREFLHELDKIDRDIKDAFPIPQPTYQPLSPPPSYNNYYFP